MGCVAETDATAVFGLTGDGPDVTNEAPSEIRGVRSPAEAFGGPMRVPRRSVSCVILVVCVALSSAAAGGLT